MSLSYPVTIKLHQIYLKNKNNVFQGATVLEMYIDLVATL